MTMVCHKCVGDDFLKDRIRQQGAISKCDYCNSRVKSIDIEELSEWVGDVLGQHYYEGDSWPTFDEDDRVSYEQEGEEFTDIINTILDAKEQVVEDVINDLTSVSYSDYKDGGTSRYDIGVCYVERGVNHSHVEGRWDHFKYELSHTSRFFNDRAKQFLDSLMQDIHSLRGFGKVKSVIYTIKPKDTMEFYRARLANKPNELETILKNNQIGPPPPELATAGRMNGAGISVFYGALDRKTCIAELRPSLGSPVVTGLFKLIKPIRVLDFRLLEKCYHDQPLSYFQPDFDERVTYRQLLRSLHGKIRQPILPGSENEYLITQVLAEYFINILDPRIDGVLFSSVQNENGINIVLFNHVLDIQSNSSTSLGPSSVLEFDNESLRIHRITSIEYGDEERNPKEENPYDPDDDIEV